MTLQEQYDDAMFDVSTADYDRAIEKLRAILAADPNHFDAQLSLGMAYYRKGDYTAAIAEGHKAEKMKPAEQLVHVALRLGDVPMHHHLDETRAFELASLQLPLPTARLHLDASDPRLPLIEEVLREEGLELSQLKVKGVREMFFSKGDRPALCLPAQLRWIESIAGG